MEYKNGLFMPHTNKKIIPAMNFDDRVRSTLDPIFKRGGRLLSAESSSELSAL